jgi:hypothetical protein
MALEFKLSYTAEDINNRLGRIDSLATKGELPTKTSDLTNDSGFVNETYVNDKIAEFSANDASGQVSAHNTSESAHSDIRDLISGLDADKLDASELTSAINTALAQAKDSGEFEGSTGVGISSVQQTTTSTADDGNNIITVTLTNGATSTFTIQNGSKGSAGETPVRGTDYWTEADKAEIKSYVDEAILGGAW